MIEPSRDTSGKCVTKLNKLTYIFYGELEKIADQKDRELFKKTLIELSTLLRARLNPNWNQEPEVGYWFHIWMSLPVSIDTKREILLIVLLPDMVNYILTFALSKPTMAGYSLLFNQSGNNDKSSEGTICLN